MKRNLIYIAVALLVSAAKGQDTVWTVGGVNFYDTRKEAEDKAFRATGLRLSAHVAWVTPRLLWNGPPKHKEDRLGDFDGTDAARHVALFDFILRGTGNDCMARIITDTTYRLRGDYRALAKEMLARYRRECTDPLVSAWDAYSKECYADKEMKRNLIYIAVAIAVGCSDYEPSNYTIERNGFGQYRVRKPLCQHHLFAADHWNYLSHYGPLPWPFSNERDFQVTMFRDSVEAMAAILRHIDWLRRSDSLDALGRWEAIP